MKKGTILLLLLVGVLVFLQIRGCQKDKSDKEFMEALVDELKHEKNADGTTESYIRALESQHKNDLLRLKTNDKSLKWLQSVVKDFNGKIATALISQSSSSSKGNSLTEIRASDTIKTDSMIFVYPKYETEWENEWERGKIVASKDSVFRDIKIANKYEITLGRASNGWFKPRTNEVRVKNLNPNTITQELRSFTVKQKPKRISLGLHLGYGATVRDNQVYLTPVISGGLNIAIVQIK